MKEIIAAIQSFKVLCEIVKANKGLIDYNEVVSAVAEVNGKLVEAQAVALASQEKQSLLSERVRELEKKIMEFENWESEIQKYELHTFPTGTSALALKPEMQITDQVHYLCESCAGKRQKERMQPDGFRNGNSYYLRCHNCNLLIQTRPMSGALEGMIKAKMKV